MTNPRQAAKIKQKYMDIRNSLWGHIATERLWHRKTNVGFVTIPKTMPLIMQIMNDMSPGKPVSQTYFTLWCHTWDQSMVEIQNTMPFAFESGFTGKRAESTWKGRMKILSNLKFIDIKPAQYGEFSYILIWYPHKVLKKYYDNGKIIRPQYYTALMELANRIGAGKDFSD